MRRGEIWWAELGGKAGRRPVVLLSRDVAYPVRELVTVAPVTARVRNIPVEVPLGKSEGLSRECAINLDTITTIPKRRLLKRISALPPDKVEAMNKTMSFALGLTD